MYVIFGIASSIISLRVLKNISKFYSNGKPKITVQWEGANGVIRQGTSYWELRAMVVKKRRERLNHDRAMWEVA